MNWFDAEEHNRAIGGVNQMLRIGYNLFKKKELDTI
jgi:hypothetical protein